MPKNKSALERYYIIDDCLTNKRKRFPNKIYILEKLEDILQEGISESTLHKDFAAMKQLFGAPISYNRYREGYYYQDENFSMSKFPLTEKEIEALDFSTALFQKLKGTKMFSHLENAINRIIDVHRISKHIGKSESQILQIEEPPAMQDNGYLETILEAIVQEQCLKIKYQPFNKTVKEHHVSPYVLKEYRNRWYAVGYSNLKKEVLTFGLDRIKSLSPCKEKYISARDFNPQDFFKYSLGIIQRHAKQPERVVLWFSKEQAPYIQSQKLHHSQKLIKEYTGEIEIELTLYTTQELKMTILSYGNDVKVLSPETLQTEIKEIIEKAGKLYK